MSFVVGALLKQFGPTSGGGDPPDSPTLTVLDNADGTATATISGSTAGTTNTVYVMAWLSDDGWSIGGSRVGNGTVLLTLDPGYYFAQVVSENADGQAVSDIVLFYVSGEPAGLRNDALLRLQDLIVNCPSARERIAPGATVAATKQRIFWPHLDKPASVPFPQFVITPRDTGGTRDSTNTFSRSGSLALKIMDLVRGDFGTAEGLKAAASDFMLFADNLCLEMEALALLDDNLAIQTWRDTVHPSLGDPRKTSDNSLEAFFFIEITISWNPSGAAGQ